MKVLVRFHLLSVRNALTFRFDFSSRIALSIQCRIGSRFGIQESLKKIILFPLRAIHLQASEVSFQPRWTFNQVLDTTLLAPPKTPTARRFAQSLLGFVIIFQASLDKIALFLTSVCWIPKPPGSLLQVTVSQLTRWIFLLASIVPQRKSLVILSTEEETSQGAWCNSWCEMVCQLQRILQGQYTARLRTLLFHPASFVFMLLLMY